jgi:hypothetical protein
MRIVTVHSSGHTETGVTRLLDGDRRTLTIMSPWGQPLGETLRAIWPELTPTERHEVWAAFDLGKTGCKTGGRQ